MKKLSILLISICSFIAAFSQTYPNRSALGGPGTLSVFNPSGAVQGVIVLNGYSDTSAVNAFSYIRFTPGAMIRTYLTGDTVWMRSNDASKWLKVGSGGPSGLQANITYDPLLTANNVVEGGNFNWTFQNSKVNLTEANDSILFNVNSVNKLSIRSDTMRIRGRVRIDEGSLTFKNASFPSAIVLMKSDGDVVSNLHYSNSSKHVTWNIYGTEPGLAFHVDYSPSRLTVTPRLLWGARPYYAGLGDSMVFAFSKWTGPAEMALDPAVNGQLYYWNLTNKFRAYQNSVWRSVAMIGDAVDSMFNNAGGDSLIYTIDARRHALPYPAGGGGSLTTTDNNLSISGSVISTNTIPVALTDGVTVTWIVANGINATLTLTGNGHTLAITSPQSGKTYLLQLTQDGTGGWGSFTLPGGGTAVLNPTAGATTVLIGYYNGTSYTWSSNYTTNPTWQQTLTAGSTLTTNNTIAGGGFSFTFDNISDFQVADASNPRFQLRASKTQLYGPTITRNLDISDSIRWNGLGQGIDTVKYKIQVINPVTGALSYSPWLYAGGGGGGSSALSAITAATAGNTIDNTNYAQEWQWSTLGAGIGLSLTSTSTAAASNTQALFNVSLSGANSTSSQTTNAVTISNTHTGTTSKNIGATISASGATNNFGARISPALLIGSPTENATDGIIIQSPTNTASDGLRIYANNNSSFMQYGWATITRAGALTIATTSGAINVTPSTGVYIGSTSTATALLQVAAGSTSKSPIRLTSGSLTTGGNILAGNMEFLTDKLYFTITTGTAVKEITLNDAPLTSGTVPVATTNGRLTDGLIISSGTYTPTVAGTVNLTSQSLNGTFQYMRVGNIVHVSGQIDLTQTAANTITSFTLTLPITSSFTQTYDATGHITNSTTDRSSGDVLSNSGASTVTVEWFPTTTTNGRHYISFQYIIK